MQPKTTTPLHTPRMRRLGPGLWCVESKTQQGVGHQCTVDACSCPAGRHNRLCWHRRLVRQAEAWYATGGAGVPVAPVPAPVPATVASDWHTSAAYHALAECFE